MNQDTVMCKDCIHSEVCKYREEFADIQRQFTSLKIRKDNDDPRKVTFIPMENFSYIEVPRLNCRNYLRMNTIRSL